MKSGESIVIDFLANLFHFMSLKGLTFDYLAEKIGRPKKEVLKMFSKGEDMELFDMGLLATACDMKLDFDIVPIDPIKKAIHHMLKDYKKGKYAVKIVVVHTHSITKKIENGRISDVTSNVVLPIRRWP